MNHARLVQQILTCRLVPGFYTNNYTNPYGAARPGGFDNTGTAGWGSKVLFVLLLDLIFGLQGWNMGAGAPMVTPWGGNGGGWDPFMGILNPNKKAQGINPKQVAIFTL